ncbi:hypothetical protein KQI84_19195 [bacterium]|nr:hypothetical protein [bacterium]
MKTTILSRYTLGFCLTILLAWTSVFAEQVPISEVGSELKGQQVEIVGRIANKIAPMAGDAPYRWYLTDDEGAITILLAQSVGKELDSLNAGQVITVTGPVELDRFSPVIRVSSSSQIKLGGELLTAKMKRERARASQATPRPPEPARRVPPVATMAPTPRPTPAAARRQQNPPRAQATPDWAMVTPTPRFSSALMATPDLDKGDPSASRFDLNAPFEGFPGAIAPEDLTEDMIGKEVTMTGKIIKVYASRHDRMPNALRMLEEPREIGIVYYPDIAPEVERGLGVAMPGQMVTARGTVGTYKDQLQVRVTQPSDIILQGSGRTLDSVKNELVEGVSADMVQAFRAAESLPQVTPVGEAADHVGEAIIIVGFINDFRAAWNDRAPNILSVRDSSGSTEVVFWDDIAKNFDEAKYGKTTPIVIHGMSDKYRDRLQIKPGSIEDIQILDPQNFQKQIEAMAARRISSGR